MEDDLPRSFRGVWIPREIWLHRDLKLIEKVLFAEIDSLDAGERGCTAGNDHFARIFGVSETTISTSISHLIELGYVERESFDGRTRILRSTAGFQKLKGGDADFQKLKGRVSKTGKQGSKSRKAIHESTGSIHIENGDAHKCAEPDPLPDLAAIPAEIRKAAADTLKNRKPTPHEGSAAWRDMLRVEAARLMGETHADS